MYNVGPYTFAPFKLVWREQTSSFAAGVIDVFEGKVVVADHKTMMVPFELDMEAHFCCACLNNSVASSLIRSYTVSTQINTHVLRYFFVPRFDRSNKGHERLAKLSKEAHQLKEAGKQKELTNLEQQIDQAAAGLWGIESKELEQIQKALKESED